MRHQRPSSRRTAVVRRAVHELRRNSPDVHKSVLLNRKVVSMINEMVISPKAELSEDVSKKVTEIRQSSMPSPSLRLPTMPQCKSGSVGRMDITRRFTAHTSSTRRHSNTHRVGARMTHHLAWMGHHPSGSRQDTHSTLDPLRLEALGGSTARALHTQLKSWAPQGVSTNLLARLFMSSSLVKYVKAFNKRKTALGCLDSRRSTLLENWGIYHIDPDDPLHEKCAQKVRKLPLDDEMPFTNVTGRGETSFVNPNTRRTRNACIIEAHGSTRSRMGKNQRRDHEDLIAEKGFNSLSHYNRVHWLSPIHQAMKILNAKAAVDRESEKFEQLPAWHATKVAVIDKAQKEEKI